jgi:hypothetical protein
VVFSRFRCADGAWRMTRTDGDEIPDRVEAALRSLEFR